MPTKSNEQIRRDYAQQGVVSQLGTAADDMARIAANGITGGLVLDQDAVREARVRAGLAGDIANVGGMLLGAKGVGALAKGARVLPAAARVASAGGLRQAVGFLSGKAGPALVPVAAGPSKMALAKAAGALGLLGVSIAGRQDEAAPAAAPQDKPAERDGIWSEDAAAATASSPQQSALDRLGEIINGPVSHRRLMQAVQGVAQVSPKPIGARDAAGMVAEQQAMAMNNAVQQEIQSKVDAGTMSKEDAQKAGMNAFNAYLKQRAMVWGTNNPLGVAQVPMMPDEAGVN